MYFNVRFNIPSTQNSFSSFLCLKCKSLTILTYIRAKFVSREVFSHSSDEGDDVCALPQNIIFKYTLDKLDS